MLSLLCAASAVGHASAADPQSVQPSTLSSLLARHVEENPQASLADVAAMANAAIQTQGVEFRFDAQVDDSVDSLELHAPDRSFLTAVPFDGMAIGPCGELWVPLPLAGVADDRLSLVQQQQVWPVERPPELVLDEMSVLAPDGATVLATVEVPWQSTPFGVISDGSGIVLRQALPEERAAQWWANQRAADPQITAEYPFVPLIVTDDGVRYADDATLLRDASAKPVEPVEDATNAYHGRIEFLEPHYIVDFTAPCT
jgi:hypothetical protein